MLSPKLPTGHNMTTNIAINWQNKAVFSFIVDHNLTIRSAVLDLEQCTWTEHNSPNNTQMDWALILEQNVHKIDRMHLKTGAVQDDKTIAIMGRGRTEGMRQQISGIMLYFTVTKNEDDGKYTLTHTCTQRVFPSIFCRQLDFAQIVGDKFVVTQDTADDELFEAFSVNMTPGVFRGDNVC